MTDLYLKRKKYSFPDAWDELKPDQFIGLVTLLHQYEIGEISADQVRQLYFLMVAGLKPRRIRKTEKAELFAENIVRAARHFRFFFCYEYAKQKSFSKMDPDIREKLRRFDPDELEQVPEVRAAAKMEREIRIDAVFGANLIPVLHHAGSIFPGYVFKLKEDILETTFTAGQYVDAVSVFQDYSKKPSETYLDLLIGILYQRKYSSSRAHQLGPVFRNLPAVTRQAILFNFAAVHTFMASRSKYHILFAGSCAKETDVSKASLIGFHDSIYSLSKAGYGSTSDLEKEHLVTFLDLMLKELRDAAAALKESGAKLPEISRKMKLTVAQIKQLI